jgi:hypothetical protein
MRPTSEASRRSVAYTPIETQLNLGHSVAKELSYNALRADEDCQDPITRYKLTKWSENARVIRIQSWYILFLYEGSPSKNVKIVAL